jgi:hypothetical protein
MNVTLNPASATSFADIASKHPGIIAMPGSARTSRIRRFGKGRVSFL